VVIVIVVDVVVVVVVVVRWRVRRCCPTKPSTTRVQCIKHVCSSGGVLSSATVTHVVIDDRVLPMSVFVYSQRQQLLMRGVLHARRPFVL
jgi:hypothetical protein